MDEKLLKGLGEKLTEQMLNSLRDAASDFAVDTIHDVIDQLRENMFKGIEKHKADIINELSDECVYGDIRTKIQNRVFIYMIQNTNFVEKMGNNLIDSLEINLRESIQKV